MNDVFMVNGGKRTQKIEGDINVAPTVGAATEAKQDTIIASIEDIGVTNDVKVTLDGEVVPVTGTFFQATQPVSLASVPSHPVTFTGSTDVATNTTLATRLSESDFDSKIGSLTEGAPANDTASSGLNGRLQRIAQRITSLIALLPTALGQGTMATSLKVVLPSDQSAIPVTMTSTTITGTPAVQDLPVTSGGLLKFHLVGAATTNATNIKASAGQVYAITAFNISDVPIFLKFHNTAGTPTAGTGVTDTFLIPANTSGSGVVINIDKGIAFGTGIGITLVTGIADANNTAIAASSVVLNIYYK